MRKVLLLFFITFILFLGFEVQAFPASSSPIYNGIDVSEWQGNIDFSKVKNSGIEVVYIRASEGYDYKDPYYLDNYKGAKSNDLKVGFYHYLTATNEEEALIQANFFVSVIKGLQVDCKLAMDFEYFDGLSVTEINEIAEIFLKEVSRLSGKETVIYSDAYNAKYTFSNTLAQIYPIWVADYDVTSPGNGNWNTWVGFQYSDRGIINGINSFVDKDYFTNDILLSNSTEIPTNTSTETPNNISYIIVQSGNTLSQIAARYNTSYEYLAKINNIQNPNLIYIGEKLEVPILENNYINDTSHKLYIIKFGNTLSQIANKFDVSIQSIITLNNISNPNLIFAGSTLRIPTINTF